MTTKPKAAAKKPPAKKPAAAAAKKPAGKPASAAKKPAGKPKKPAAQIESSPEVFVPHHEIAEIIDAEVITSAPRDAEGAAAEVHVEPEVEASPPPELSDEEREISAIYGDDLAASAPTAHTEYTDRQTADEDRPMVPEINAREERKHRWDERREGRRSRRDRGGDRGPRPPQAGGGGQPQQQQNHNAQPNHNQPRRDDNNRNANQHPQQRLPLPPPPQMVAEGTVPIAVAAIHEHDALARVGTPLGDAATSVFAQLRNNQPLPVKQLAAMMRKRNLVTVEPDQLWPQLKAELLGDERSYRSLGLRPRIIYRGRDLFAPGPVATSMTADAEAGMAAALSRLAGATHRALAQRVARATSSGFERLIHAYLVAAGYRDIDWVKRVDGISYAAVTAPGIERTVLVSARSGDRPIDRRGIGELRVGVEAKNLVAGILFSAASLSEDAERELERPGRSISVVCGDQLVAMLIAGGVGVVSRTAPLHYVDDQLLDELMQG